MEKQSSYLLLELFLESSSSYEMREGVEREAREGVQREAVSYLGHHGFGDCYLHLVQHLSQLLNARRSTSKEISLEPLCNCWNAALAYSYSSSERELFAD